MPQHEEQTIISSALKHEKAQACASQPAPFVIPSGIAKELTSMMQTWLMNKAACPPAVRQEPDNQYKLPNSNDGCMWLRAPTTCPKWNEGTDEDITVLHWLSKNAGLTSECITEVIELFAREQLENSTTSAMWNVAAKCAAAKQVMQPPPCPPKAVELTTALSRGKFDQYPLLA